MFYRAFPGAVPGMVHNARQRGQPRCYNFSFLKLCQNIYDTPFTTGDRRSSWWRSIVSQWCLFFRPCRQQGVLFLFFFFENFRETKCNDLRLNFYTLFFLLETILSFIYFLKFDVKGGGGRWMKYWEREDVEMVFEYLERVFEKLIRYPERYLDEINLNILLRVSSHLFQFVQVAIKFLKQFFKTELSFHLLNENKFWIFQKFLIKYLSFP